MDFIWYFCHKLILNDSFCSLLFFIKPISNKWNPQLMSKINYDSTRWLSKTRGMVSAECQYGLTVQISSAAEAGFRPCQLQSRVEVLNLSVTYIVWYHCSRHYVQMPYIVGTDKVDYLLFFRKMWKIADFIKLGSCQKGKFHLDLHTHELFFPGVNKTTHGYRSTYSPLFESTNVCLSQKYHIGLINVVIGCHSNMFSDKAHDFKWSIWTVLRGALFDLYCETILETLFFLICRNWLILFLYLKHRCLDS